MIVYGWNNYLLKSITPEELGIFAKDQPEMKFEYRQKYFHLFFIPFFPIGRFWAVKIAGQMYEPTPDALASLQSLRATGKKGVWAWSGILAIAAAVFFYNISSSIAEKQYQKDLAVNVAALSAFFREKEKTSPLAGKLHTMYNIIDSSFEKDEYEEKKIDTSYDNLIKLYFDAQLTHVDSLTGYNETNTFLASRFHGTDDEEVSIISNDTEEALKNGKWQSGYGDTSNVFAELRNLQNYRHVLLLKEYNRVAPGISDSNYISGYSFVKAYIINIASGKVTKTFRLMTGNSDRVSHMSISGKTDATGWRRILDGDLKRNVLDAARKYVFGKDNDDGLL
jgi:hypothetical protein